MDSVIYAVIWQDRHADTEVYLFSDPDVAIAWASRQAHEHNLFGDLDEQLLPSMIKAGWLYYGCYSCEGDHLRVVPCAVDAEATGDGCETCRYWVPFDRNGDYGRCRYYTRFMSPRTNCDVWELGEK